MQEIKLTLKVNAKAQLDENAVVELLNELLNSGMSQAATDIETGQGNTEQAKLMKELEIHALEVAKPATVLVVVEGGIADAVWDGNVDLEVFDWDNYNDDPVWTSPVPYSHAHLAAPINVPYENEDESLPGQDEERN